MPATTVHIHTYTERTIVGVLEVDANACVPRPQSYNGHLAVSWWAEQEACVCSLQELSSVTNSPLPLPSAVGRAEFGGATNTLINVCFWLAIYGPSAVLDRKTALLFSTKEASGKSDLFWTPFKLGFVPTIEDLMSLVKVAGIQPLSCMQSSQGEFMFSS